MSRTRGTSLSLIASLLSLLVIVGCNNHGDEKAKAEKMIREAQETASQKMSEASKLVESSKELAQEQLKQAEEMAKTAGAAVSSEATKALETAKESVDAAKAKVEDMRKDPMFERREAAAYQAAEMAKAKQKKGK